MIDVIVLFFIHFFDNLFQKVLLVAFILVINYLHYKV